MQTGPRDIFQILQFYSEANENLFFFPGLHLKSAVLSKHQLLTKQSCWSCCKSVSCTHSTQITKFLKLKKKTSISFKINGLFISGSKESLFSWWTQCFIIVILKTNSQNICRVSITSQKSGRLPEMWYLDE